MRSVALAGNSAAIGREAPQRRSPAGDASDIAAEFQQVVIQMLSQPNLLLLRHL